LECSSTADLKAVWHLKKHFFRLFWGGFETF
jgi:hypothetical protein